MTTLFQLQSTDIVSWRTNDHDLQYGYGNTKCDQGAPLPLVPKRDS